MNHRRAGVGRHSRERVQFGAFVERRAGDADKIIAQRLGAGSVSPDCPFGLSGL